MKRRSHCFLLLVSARVALYRERRYTRALEAQLEGEKDRNRAREDEMMTVPMRMLGMYGVATREGPAQPREPLRRQIQQRTRTRTDPWAMLSDDERREWQLFKADADPDGTNTAAVKREFLEMIEYRRANGDAEIM